MPNAAELLLHPLEVATTTIAWDQGDVPRVTWKEVAWATKSNDDESRRLGALRSCPDLCSAVMNSLIVYC
eukprot:322571-Amphidinium_carterae.1